MSNKIIGYSPLEETDPVAQVNWGNASVRGGDYKTAAVLFKKAAEQGVVVAQCNLAIMYRDGQGVSQDYKEAFFWFMKAAEQGDPMSQYSIGLFYRNGQGVAQNIKLAMLWYQKAAIQNHIDAMYNLASIYFKGASDISINIAMNHPVAYVWFRLGADAGDAECLKFVQYLDEKLDKRLQVKAHIFYKEATRLRNKNELTTSFFDGLAAGFCGDDYHPSLGVTDGA